MITRRLFLRTTAGAAALAALRPTVALGQAGKPAAPPFKISLAQWSLHRELQAKTLDHLDFAMVARKEFGIEAVEYVNSFFKDKAEDAAYLAEMNRRAKDLGVYQHLIMIDGEGRLGDPDAAKRTQAVENHYKWVTAAKTLGCATIRVNAGVGGHVRGADGAGGRRIAPRLRVRRPARHQRRRREPRRPVVQRRLAGGRHAPREPPALRHAARLRQLLRVRPLPGRDRPDAVREGRQREDARLRRPGPGDHQGLLAPDAQRARRRLPLVGRESSTKARGCRSARASRPACACCSGSAIS